MIDISVSNLSKEFEVGKKILDGLTFQVDQGERVGLLGKNGAGKTTLFKILTGELDWDEGEVHVAPGKGVGLISQIPVYPPAYTVEDVLQTAFDRLHAMEAEMTRLAEQMGADTDPALLRRYDALTAAFEAGGGYDTQTELNKVCNGLEISQDMRGQLFSSLSGGEKTRVNLARLILEDTDILLLDEPTNHLDIHAVEWLEDFILECESLIIVVSHDRHFLNTVCTNIVDVDYGGIKMYVGNYEFWYESSQMMQRLIRDQNKKKEEKIKELQEFVSRFSANKSKSKQATARRKLLDKLTVEEMPASSRRYPFVGFKMDREPGKEILAVEGLTKTVDGRKVLDNVSFRVNKGDKIAFVGEDEIATTTLFKILMEELEPDAGTFKWGTTITTSYFPLDNSAFFNDCDLNLVDWLGQYTADNAEEGTESFKRSFLGRMLFSGDDVYKPVKVLSGGEKVRCMLSRMMLFGSNALVLDQPTNHLDLESITAVNNGLIDFKGVVLFASHDHEFVQTIANRVMEFVDGKLIDKMCTYDAYIAGAREEMLARLNG